MATTALPSHLPRTVDQLIDDLDLLNPSPVVTGTLTDAASVQELVFLAGRRSVVDELIRVREREKEN